MCMKQKFFHIVSFKIIFIKKIEEKETRKIQNEEEVIYTRLQTIPAAYVLLWLFNKASLECDSNVSKRNGNKM